MPLKEQLDQLRRQMAQERDARERDHTSGGPRMPDRAIQPSPVEGVVTRRSQPYVRNLRLLGKAHYS
jgi:hypothetical protein